MSVAYAYPPHMNGGVPGMTIDGQYGGGGMHSSFAFKKRFERIDWKKIASTDIDSISRNLDFNALQDNIMNITFCSIESEVDTRMMDPNFLKLFKLAQLTIEYLLHSQDYLSSMVGTLETKLKKAIEEHEETKKTLEKSQTELGEVKKECHKRKKMLMAQQQILQAGANSYNKCMCCSKAFINVTFLQSHMARRHPEYMATSQGSGYNAAPPQQNMVPPPSESQGQISQEQNEELEKELTEIRNRLRLTESQLVEERNARNRQDQDAEARQKRERKLSMDRWKEEQREQHQQEMDRMKNMFMKELKEMNEKQQSQNLVIDKLQTKLGDKSNMGDLDYEQDELRKQRETVAMLKEELQTQVKSMDNQLQSHMKKKDKDWHDKMKKMEKQHQMQIDELSEALEQSVQDIEKDEIQVRVQYEKNLKDAHDVLERSNELEMKSSDPHRDAEYITKQSTNSQQNQNVPKKIKDEVKKATSPRSTLKMEPPSDDETTAEIKEAVSTMDTAGPSTLRTLQGTGSLSLNGTRQAQLLAAIRKNPEFLKGMKKQLTGVFDNVLEKRGVSKNAEGMSSMDYTNKAGILKQERQQKASKLPNFWDIRQQYINEIDHLAKQRMQNDKKNKPHGPTSLSSSAPLQLHASRPQNKSPNLPRGAPVQRSQSQGQPPRPSPRHSTGGPNRAPNSPSRGGDHSQADDTMTGSQWSSDEDDDEEDESEEESDDEEDDDDDEDMIPDPANRKTQPAQPRQPSPRRNVPSPQHHQQQTAGSGRLGNSTAQTKKVITTTTTAKKTTTKTFDDDNDDDDDDDDEDSWGDDISELNVMDPETPRGKVSQNRPQVRGSQGSTASTPKGAKVAKLTQSIEAQLQGRSVKKPAGAIDTMKKQDNSDSDDSLATVSDDDDDEPSPAPKANVRHAPTRGSTQTNYSTDTYGTSAWGTGSKAGQQASVNKSVSKASTSGDVEVSDWDSDDLDIKDL